MKKRKKISKNCIPVFGKVKQNSDGEVRILLGKWSNLLGKWSNLLGRWSNLLGKWSKFDGEMKQNDGQMKQNLMGRCPIDKVHTTLSINVSSRIFQYVLVRRDILYEIWNGRFVVLNCWVMGGKLFQHLLKVSRLGGSLQMKNYYLGKVPIVGG